MRSPGQLAASTDVTLAPWGRIEGVLRFGRDPAPGQVIEAVFINGPFPGFVDAEVQTDREGRFVFERVTPGRLLVCRAVRHHESGYTPSHRIAVDVAPGPATRIQIGGTGRPVVGRLALPSGVAMNHFRNGPARLHTEPLPMPIPPELPRLTDEQWSAWRDALRWTPQWEMYFEGEHQYAVAFRPDGTFRIEDVPAGRYILELPFHGNAGGDQPARRAYVKADVVVPEMAGGRSDEPLDIGVIPMDVFPIRELNIGDRAPTITARDSDGRPLDLAALRGKYVLLAFWATSHVATRANIPHLNATHDAFGRDPRLVMIGLNQDMTPELMRRYAAHRGLAWEQRHLGGWGDTNPIAAAFGVRYPAAVFLIGPDGRILAKDLQGDGIQQAVARALGRSR
jgi:cytochrome oxidase Cu insertion factor (SCO1/SenC/PrrC family)